MRDLVWLMNQSGITLRTKDTSGSGHRTFNPSYQRPKALSSEDFENYYSFEWKQESVEAVIKGDLK